MVFIEWMYGFLFGDAGEALKGKADEITAQVDPLKPLVEKPGFNSVFINGRYQYVPKPTQPIQPGLPNQNTRVNQMVEALKFWKPLQ